MLNTIAAIDDAMGEGFGLLASACTGHRESSVAHQACEQKQ
jgi:hypothetical protein